MICNHYIRIPIKSTMKPTIAVYSIMIHDIKSHEIPQNIKTKNMLYPSKPKRIKHLSPTEGKGGWSLCATRLMVVTT